MRKLLFTVLTILFVSFASQAQNKQPKYVFYMIGDGMGINQVFGTQLFNRATGIGQQTINFTQFPLVSFVTTQSASSLVTDSAAGGTALATGVKTYNDGLGVDPDKNPISSVADWAKASGFGVGVATSVGVNHATPASFYGHAEGRSEYEKIATQLIASKVDFAAGGGFINEAKKTGHDSQYLENLAKEAGISILRGAELKNAASHKERIICLGSDTSKDNLKPAFDRQEGDTGLGEFVQAGIDNLYAKYADKGFFFMIEGGKIDNAGHDDDGITNFYELNDFANCVDIVLAFYNQHPDETLIVISADHETGALMLGAGRYEMSPELLLSQKYSEGVLNTKYKEFMAEGTRDWEAVKGFLKENLGLWDSVRVNPQTEAQLRATFERSISNRDDNVVTLYSVSTRIISEAIDALNQSAGYSWGHGSHTGSPVGLYVKGAGYEEFMSCRDNIDLPKTIAKVAGYQK